MVSLGCPKALVDSERIITQLRAEGYDIAPSYDGSDLVIVNTCGFIDDAVAESLDAIGEALAENGRVIVTGCLGARQDKAGSNLVRAIHPKVLAVTGPHATDEVMAQVHANLPKPHDPFTDLVPPAGIKLTPRHYAYLKISEGCNHRCSFCIIPSMRGDLVSRPIGDVLREAGALVRGGVRELLVVSQDTSAYGVDLRYRTGFVDGRPVRTRMTELVRELGRLDAWVRLHYVYPYPHVDEVVELMAGAAGAGRATQGQGRILPYLDVPLQHSHPRVLKAMKRPASGEKNIERIAAWRRVCPALTIRSTFIVGFPGETEQEFRHLLEFLDEAELDRVGCFAYSPVEGATANELPGAVPDEVREERRARFMEVQSAISERRLRAKVGATMQVLVDGFDDDGEAIARSAADAPEIDGVVHVAADASLKIGEFASVIIDGSDEHDLYGRVVQAAAPAR
ncbi:MAG TPA: 30S ribosomal protein S12 methylthiotransferase RimO [Burkholderiaceae bacterium]|nr:30S ribosomal protein S12 methylthiotransferase RimO [Burkholderiaceae bacterium]